MPEGEPVSFTVGPLTDADGADVTCANHPMMELWMRLPHPAPRFSILRKAREMR
jgi:hypothetical protein